ncbi:hypothetical protein OIU77_012490 [Salix suchowensis]|uniref:Amino acid transporter transmembrane domain-containing protein n=1 Tax=Salix suchowensis TaxID=1278906 RepID=A0ABQ9A4X7_9ROSI|nr:hypothetical protein OIU77_012490 [Salix suchowensis]
MSNQKPAEEEMVSINDAGHEEKEEVSNDESGFSLKSVLWHGGSVYDAWFSCSSNQVAQVLLTLPYSFSQMGMLSGIILQIFYGVLGSWTAYLISVLYVEYRSRKEKENVSFRNHVIQWFEVLDGLLGPSWKAIGLAFNCTFLLFGSVIQLIACASNIYYIDDKLDKRTWTYIFGACCATTVFIPSFHNYRIWSFLGLGMTTYTAWYMTVASLVHGQVEGVIHSGPTKGVLYFTGATNILYTFGGHAVTVEIMHAMWKPQKFKYIYLFATLYVLTLTLPSASATYWAFGDQLLTHSNALSLLPRTPWRDAAVVLMLIHQFITFGFACTPLYFVWEKAVGALLVSFTVYIIPSLAHMLTYRSASARQLSLDSEIDFAIIAQDEAGSISLSFRYVPHSHFYSYVSSHILAISADLSERLARVTGLVPNHTAEGHNAAEKPPFFIPSWTAMYVLNAFIVVWVLVVGFGLGGWASMSNFIKQVDTFGLFAKCYQCPPSTAAKHR